jgi:hypothetical protein
MDDMESQQLMNCWCSTKLSSLRMALTEEHPLRINPAFPNSASPTLRNASLSPSPTPMVKKPLLYQTVPLALWLTSTQEFMRPTPLPYKIAARPPYTYEIQPLSSISFFKKSIGIEGTEGQKLLTNMVKNPSVTIEVIMRAVEDPFQVGKVHFRGLFRVT